MPNYSNSSIYKLCSNDSDIKDIYIGSTTNFRTRKNGHKSTCHNNSSKGHDLKVYQFIRENGGWDAFDMVELERYKATDKRSLHTRERYWIDTLQPVLNSQIPTQTLQDYYVNNKESIKLKNKQYREINKESIATHKKTQFNCIHCGSITRLDDKSRHEKSNKCIYNQIYNFIHS